MASVPEWQHPYVNVFKMCGALQGPSDGAAPKDVERAGKVAERMDATIGKRVYRIGGAIPAANYVRLPAANKPLTLTGRFAYLQVRLTPATLFSIHLECCLADGNVVRVSISNIFKQDASGKRKAASVQLPLLQPPTKWAVLAVDLPAALGHHSSSPFQALRGVQLCATLLTRGLFTSDIKFGFQGLPSELMLSHTLPPSEMEWVWLPEEPTDVPEAVLTKPGGAPRSLAVSNVRRGCTPSHATDDAGGSSSSSRDVGGAVAADEALVVACGVAASDGAATTRDQGAAAAAPAPAADPDAPPSRQASTGPWRQCTPPTASKAAAATAGGGVAEPQAVDGPLSEPLLQLERVNGFTGEFTRCMAWAPTTGEVAIAAASTVVALDAAKPAAGGGCGGSGGGSSGGGGRQRHLLGHTAHVCALAFSTDGTLLATAQEGRQAVVRLWDWVSGECLAVLCGHASALVAVDISPDGHALMAVGQDAHAKQCIVVWDISEAATGGPVALPLLRHATDFNVRVARFSAFEDAHFMTAGRDSIRVYRLRRGALRGMSVHMQVPDKQGRMRGTAAVSAAMGPHLFTDLAFEVGAAAQQLRTRHVFVASAAGAVFQVNYARRVVVAVYQLHSGAINCLALHEGMCITGSDDRLLRCWPMDFSAYLLEAEHEAPVTSLALAPGGLALAVGTEDGCVGRLDLSSRQHATLLRSHCGAVTAVAAHPARPEYCTASADATLRIWDLTTHQQLYEFGSPGDAPTAAAYRPAAPYSCGGGDGGGARGTQLQRYELAAGFESGVVRVFDVATTSVVQERQQHEGDVAQVAFTPDGSKLFSAGADGRLCVYDAEQDYLPVKFLPASTQGRAACLGVSPDGRLLATAAHDPHTAGAVLLLFGAQRLERRSRIATQLPGVSRLLFCPDSRELWALPCAADGAAPPAACSFDVSTGAPLQRLPPAHEWGCTALALDPTGGRVFTGGGDYTLRSWPWHRGGGGGGGGGGGEAYVGHAGAVLDAVVTCGRVVSVGQGDCVLVWRMAGGDAAVAAAPAQHPDHNLVGRVGLRRASGAPAGLSAGQRGRPALGMEGLAAGDELAQTLAGLVAEARGRTVDPGVASIPPPGGVALQPAGASPPPLPAPQRSPHLSHTAPRPSCAALTGFSPDARGCMHWVARAGLLAYAAAHLVVLESLGGGSGPPAVFLTHHTQPVGALALSADGALLASGSAAPEPAGRAEVAVWEVATGRLLRVLSHHARSVSGLAFSHDGVWLATIGGGAERSVVLWEVERGQAVALGRTAQDVEGLAWLPPGCLQLLPSFLTVGPDGLLLWQLGDHHLEQRRLTIPDAATTACTVLCTAAPPSAADSADGGAHGAGAQGEAEGGGGPRDERRRAAAAAAVVADACGGVWAVSSIGEGGVVEADLVAQLPCEALPVVCLHCTRGAGVVVVGGAGGALRRYVLVGSAGGSRRLWTLQQTLHLDGSRVVSLQLGAGGAEGVAATDAATAWFVHLTPGAGAKVPLVCGHAGHVHSLVAAPGDGGRMASTAADGALRLWRLEGHRAVASSEFAAESRTRCAAFLPSGAAIAAGYEDGSLRLLRVGGGGEGDAAGAAGKEAPPTVAWSVQRHPEALVAVCPHPDRPLLLSASRDGLIAVTHTDDARLLAHTRTFTAQLTPLHALALSAVDPGVAAAAWLDRFCVMAAPWEAPAADAPSLAQYRCPQVPEHVPQGVTSVVAFVPAASRLLLFASPCQPDSALLFNFVTGAAMRTFQLPRPLTCIAPAPDGSLLAFGLADGGVLVADARGQGSCELAGHCQPVAALAFSGDSGHLVSAAGGIMHCYHRAVLKCL